jgi:hypothetical protein
MRRIQCITLGVPVAVCLCGLFAAPAPAQECDTLDRVPDCYTENLVDSAPCTVPADCLDL